MVTFVFCPSNETCYNGLMKTKKSSICFPAILDLDGQFSCLSSNFVIFLGANGVYDKAELTIQNREFSLSFLYEIYIVKDLEQVSDH